MDSGAYDGGCIREENITFGSLMELWRFAFISKKSGHHPVGDQGQLEPVRALWCWAKSQG